MASKKTHTRRKRRQMNAALRHGWSAKPQHKRLGGRTGRSMHSRKPRASATKESQ